MKQAGEKLPVHLTEVLDSFEIANGWELGIKTDNAS